LIVVWKGPGRGWGLVRGGGGGGWPENRGAQVGRGEGVDNNSPHELSPAA
jgi:hypothetical protein